MPSISIEPADRFDLDEYVRLQVAAYREHLEKYRLGTDFMSSDLFAWKYSAPAGVGKLAVARSERTLLAAVAVLPLWVGTDRQRVILWRAVDIATHPAARGEGLFTKLLAALREDLAPDEILGSFPNANSTPGFKKIGGRDAAYAPTWVHLVLPSLRSARAGTELRDFSVCRSETLHRLMVLPDRSSFLRDRDYLDWRYVKHPDHSYHKHFVDDGCSDSGLIVFRETETYGRRMLLVLEWWASSARCASGLLAAATDYCRQNHLRCIVTVSNTLGAWQALRSRFVPIPRFAVPKEQVLRGVTRGEVADRLFTDKWAIQMGDLLEF